MSEHQVGNLLDKGDRIGDPAGAEVQPEGVDFIAASGGEGHCEIKDGADEKKGQVRRFIIL